MRERQRKGERESTVHVVQQYEIYPKARRQKANMHDHENIRHKRYKNKTVICGATFRCPVRKVR